MLKLDEIQNARMVVEELKSELEGELQSKIGYRSNPDDWCDIVVEDHEEQYPEEVAQIKALEETITILNKEYKERSNIW